MVKTAQWMVGVFYHDLKKKKECHGENWRVKRTCLTWGFALNHLTRPRATGPWVRQPGAGWGSADPRGTVRWG